MKTHHFHNRGFSTVVAVIIAVVVVGVAFIGAFAFNNAYNSASSHAPDTATSSIASNPVCPTTSTSGSLGSSTATVTECEVYYVFVYQEECTTNSTTTVGSLITLSQDSQASVAYGYPSNYQHAAFTTTTTVEVGGSSIVTVSNSSMSTLPACPPPFHGFP